MVSTHYRRLLALAFFKVLVSLAFFLPLGGGGAASRHPAHTRACAAAAALDICAACTTLALTHRPSATASPPLLALLLALQTAQGALLAATAAYHLPPAASHLRWARGALPLALLRLAGPSVTSPRHAFLPDCLRALAGAAAALVAHYSGDSPSSSCGVAGRPSLLLSVLLRAAATVVFSTVLQTVCWSGGTLEARGSNARQHKKRAAAPPAASPAAALTFMPDSARVCISTCRRRFPPRFGFG